MQRTLAQLVSEASRRGLSVNPHVAKNGKSVQRKGDYVDALQASFLQEKYGSDIPWALKTRLTYESPMLCQRLAVLKPAEIDDLWNGPNWVVQEKLDGVRMQIFWSAAEGFSFYSRNLSLEDYLPVAYHDNILINADHELLAKHYKSFVMDAELISTNPQVSTVMGSRGVETETALQAVSALIALNPADSIRIQQELGARLRFWGFDLLQVDGRDTMPLPLRSRLPLLEGIVNALKASNFPIDFLPVTYKDRKGYCDELIAQGMEGVVAKHLESPYVPTTSRRRDGWVKIKRSVAGSLVTGGGDTIDAYVTGFEPGDKDSGWSHLVGSLEFSVILRSADGITRQHAIARISSLPLEFREQITEAGPNGQPALASWAYNMVASLDGQDISARANRLTHARLLQWRNDRSHHDCILDEDFLKSMVASSRISVTAEDDLV